ncbi:MAG: SDR family oxidoreductase [Pirellulales bacterium]|nr:SDR family oxidoreductase [Pirellulales bacterium]
MDWGGQPLQATRSGFAKSLTAQGATSGLLRNARNAAGVSGFDVLRGHAVKKSPFSRIVEPSDLGKNALYLLSDLSSGVIGETSHVDCGYGIIGL